MVVDPEDVEWLVRVATEAQMSGSSPAPSPRRVPWEALWKAGMLVGVGLLVWVGTDLVHVLNAIERRMK